MPKTHFRSSRFVVSTFCRSSTDIFTFTFSRWWVVRELFSLWQECDIGYQILGCFRNDASNVASCWSNWHTASIESIMPAPACDVRFNLGTNQTKMRIRKHKKSEINVLHLFVWASLSTPFIWNWAVCCDRLMSHNTFRKSVICITTAQSYNSRFAVFTVVACMNTVSWMYLCLLPAFLYC